jgi:hypothetical protein
MHTNTLTLSCFASIAIPPLNENTWRNLPTVTAMALELLLVLTMGEVEDRFQIGTCLHEMHQLVEKNNKYLVLLAILKMTISFSR